MDHARLAFDAVLIIFLIILNGVLSMSEMALVSARRARIQLEAQKGSGGAAAALRLIESPAGYLAAVQVGITLVGVLAGAFGGANIAEFLAIQFAPLPLIGRYADGLALGFVVSVITVLSIVFGELIPKRLAMSHSEGLAILLGRPIELLSQASRPIVSILTFVTEGSLTLLGLAKNSNAAVTDEELRNLVEEGTRAGVFEKQEETIIKRTLQLGDCTVEEVMTKRGNVVMFEADQPVQDVLEIFRTARHSFFPVYQERPDQIIGVLSAKDLLAEVSQTAPLSIRPFLREPLFMVETLGALRALEIFKNSSRHFAVVHDEYGDMTGVLSVIDLLEAIVGILPQEHHDSQISVVHRDDGSILLDGTMALGEFSDLMGLSLSEADFSDGIKTLGGFVMDELGKVPDAGDKFLWRSWEFEVLDMDGRRVDKVLVTSRADQQSRTEP